MDHHLEETLASAAVEIAVAAGQVASFLLVEAGTFLEVFDLLQVVLDSSYPSFAVVVAVAIDRPPHQEGRSDC